MLGISAASVSVSENIRQLHAGPAEAGKNTREGHALAKTGVMPIKVQLFTSWVVYVDGENARVQSNFDRYLINALDE